MTAWNNKTLTVMSGRPAHEGLLVEAATYANAGEMAINEILYQRFVAYFTIAVAKPRMVVSRCPGLTPHMAGLHWP